MSIVHVRHVICASKDSTIYILQYYSVLNDYVALNGCKYICTVCEITFVVQGVTLSERYKICMEMCRFVRTICYKLCISQ